MIKKRRDRGKNLIFENCQTLAAMGIFRFFEKPVEGTTKNWLWKSQFLADLLSQISQSGKKIGKTNFYPLILEVLLLVRESSAEWRDFRASRES